MSKQSLYAVMNQTNFLVSYLELCDFWLKLHKPYLAEKSNNKDLQMKFHYDFSKKNFIKKIYYMHCVCKYLVLQ